MNWPGSIWHLPFLCLQVKNRPVAASLSPESTSMETIAVDDLRNLMSELRMMARRFLASESSTHSFTPTALAMTALRRVKLKEQEWEDVRWENRAHFVASLTMAMRHALVDHARRRKAKGRDNLVYFPPNEDFFIDLPADAQERPERVILLEEALVRLCSLDNRLGDVVHQFYYAGYSVSEIAHFTGLSEKTVDRDLKRARTLLRKMVEELTRNL